MAGRLQQTGPLQRLLTWRWHGGRRALIGWSATALLLVITLIATIGAQQRAARAQRAYGTVTPVWVVSHDVPAGHTFGAADAVLRHLPPAVLPEADRAATVHGRTATSAMVAGEVVLEMRLAPAGAMGAGALLAAGSVGVAVPLDLAPPGIEPGDPVVLIVAAGPLGSASSGGGHSIPGRAAHLDVAAAQLVVAVAGSEAPVVVGGLLRRELLVGLVPTP